MTIYTDETGSGINQPITNVQPSWSEGLEASFAEGWKSSGLYKSWVNHNLQSTWHEGGKMTSGVVANDILIRHNIPVQLFPVTEAVPEQLLDILVAEQQDTLLRQQIIKSIPYGSTFKAVSTTTLVIGNPIILMVLVTAAAYLINKIRRSGKAKQ